MPDGECVTAIGSMLDQLVTSHGLGHLSRFLISGAYYKAEQFLFRTWSMITTMPTTKTD